MKVEFYTICEQFAAVAWTAIEVIGCEGSRREKAGSKQDWDIHDKV